MGSFFVVLFTLIKLLGTEPSYNFCDIPNSLRKREYHQARMNSAQVDDAISKISSHPQSTKSEIDPNFYIYRLQSGVMSYQIFKYEAKELE